MDASRFDRVAQMLSAHASRRQTLFVLALSGLAGTRQLEASAARHKRKKKRKSMCPPCGVCETCIKGTCKPALIGTPCGAGGQCLANGSCAVTCSPGSCNPICLCGFPSVEGPSHCIFPAIGCDQSPLCSSTAECPRGSHCQSVPLCGIGENRCVPLCAL